MLSLGGNSCLTAAVSFAVCVFTCVYVCTMGTWGSSSPSYNIIGYLVINGEANVKLLSMSTNGCGPPGGTSGTYTITLDMVQPHLWGTSPPPGGFSSTGS